jgi:hypothetical protein
VDRPASHAAIRRSGRAGAGGTALMGGDPLSW